MDYSKYFETLIDWKKLPAYRLEPRIYSLIWFYLPEMLNDLLSISVAAVIPELPIRLGTVRPELNEKCYAERSYKVDFYALAKNGRNLFVEVKTDSGSRRDEQDNYLNQSKRVGMKAIVEGITKISTVSCYKTKYRHLLDKMASIGIVDTSRGFCGQDPIDVIYVQPRILENDVGKTVVDFNRVAAWLSNKYPSDGFSMSFASALESWAKD